MRCNLYTTPLVSIGSSVVAFLGILYTYIGVGLSALLVSTSIGNYVSICADQFIVRKGSWLDTYDAWGKKISSRVAR